MKQLQIELNNKEKLILVEVPEGSHGFANEFDAKNWLYYYPKNNRDIHDHRHIEFDKDFDVLGTYLPRTGEIDFEQVNWALLVDAEIDYPVTYTISQDGTKTIGDTFLKGKDLTEPQIKECILSLLKTKTEKAFPFGESEPVFGIKLKNADENKAIFESKVMPHKFIVLKLNSQKS